MLEKQIERKVCDYAKTKGIIAYKFTSPARASVPDRLFVAPGGRVFFIEFKRAGGKLTEGQTREIARLREKGASVWVVYGVEQGKYVMDMVDLGVEFERIQC